MSRRSRHSHSKKSRRRPRSIKRTSRVASKKKRQYRGNGSSFEDEYTQWILKYKRRRSTQTDAVQPSAVQRAKRNIDKEPNVTFKHGKFEIKETGRTHVLDIENSSHVYRFAPILASFYEEDEAELFVFEEDQETFPIQQIQQISPSSSLSDVPSLSSPSSSPTKRRSFSPSNPSSRISPLDNATVEATMNTLFPHLTL